MQLPPDFEHKPAHNNEITIHFHYQRGMNLSVQFSLKDTLKDACKETARLSQVATPMDALNPQYILILHHTYSFNLRNTVPPPLPTYQFQQLVSFPRNPPMQWAIEPCRSDKNTCKCIYVYMYTCIPSCYNDFHDYVDNEQVSDTREIT